MEIMYRFMHYKQVFEDPTPCIVPGCLNNAGIIYQDADGGNKDGACVYHLAEYHRIKESISHYNAVRYDSSDS